MTYKRACIFLLTAIALGLLAFSLSRPAASQNYDDRWWNASWHYRMKIEVNATGFSRTDWPVEREINFTSVLQNLGVSGAFDPNSTRVVEYNSSGAVLHEIPSQFDPGEHFSASSDAFGELVFILNGTTQNSTARYFYVYFDISENGNKSKGSYSSMLNYTWDNASGEAQINNSRFIVYIDTQRGDNTSGVYRVWGIEDESEWFFPAGASDPTIEYVELTNGSQSFTFDMVNNAAFTEGPVRIRVRQTGEEVLWNSSVRTNQTRIVKDYYFYPNSTWLRVKQNITNMGVSPVNRSSSVGMPAFDVARAYNTTVPPTTYKVTGNESNPGSWIRGTYSGGGPLTGFIHLNQSQDVFYAANTTSPQDRTGIRMNETAIGNGTSIINIFSMVFGHTVKSTTIMEDTKDRLLNEVNIAQGEPEKWVVNTHPNTTHLIYNRNETILATGNVTFDPWNITQKVNATFDMGTVSGGDDQTIALSFNSSYGNQTSGYKTFTGYFSLSNASQTGYWNITIKAYDSSGYYLNESYYTFNVTSEYFANLTIQNPLGLPGRTVYANIDVKNFRQDTWVPGASINCSYGATPVTNITDNGNGTYSVNFTAPSVYGLYTLNCSASKDGNSGFEAENFTVEAGKTNVSISRSPVQHNASNVTLYSNETFTVNVTLANSGNSSAYSTNITLFLPSGWASSPANSTCGNIPISGSCTRSFSVTIPANTSPGNFVVNITANWTNLDATPLSNSTNVTVAVSSHPLLEVPQDQMEAIMGPGNATIAGNFTVNSTGNSPLSGITFTVSGLSDFAITFTPTSIAGLGVGQSQPVQVNVTAYSNQSPGIYTGAINVSSSNNGFELANFTIIVSGTNVTLSREPQNFTANVTYYQNDSFSLHAEANNTGNVTAFYASLNVSLPQNWTANATSYWCGNISKGGICSADFLVTIVNGTPSGSYSVNVTAGWQDIGIGPRSNSSSTNVTVLSNRILVIPQDQFADTAGHGTEKAIGYITLNSTGNDPVSNITFNAAGFASIMLEFSPPNLTVLNPGGVQNITVNATVPAGHDPGTFNGTVNVTTGNDGYKTINISITVPQNGSWTITPAYCEKVQSPDAGYVCNVTVSNTGNLPLNFSIIPATSNASMSNYTWTNVTNFTVQKQQAYVFSVLYNVTGVAGQNWKISNYTVDPQQSYASPNYTIITVALNPNLTPLVSLSVTPAKAEQTSYFLIYSNATSLSGLGIYYVEVNVTRPDGTIDTVNMTEYYWPVCPFGITCWYANYSNGAWGQTILKGNYSVKVTAFDKSATNETNSTTFQVYTKLLINFSTGSPSYVQGYTGYINYRAMDYNYTSLAGANTTINIYNPGGTLQGIIFTTKNYTAGAGGWADPFPYFTLTNDAPLGNYTSTAISQYFDPDAALLVNSTNQLQFSVEERSSTGIIGYVTTPPVWYPNNQMTFSLHLYDSVLNPIDPDTMNLTIYAGSPLLSNIYLQVNLSSPLVHRMETGHYIVTYVMPPTSPTGDYWAITHATKGSLHSPPIATPFRVAQGGPYDVRLRLLDNEVPRGDFVDFEIIIENMGEAGQDVDIEYWISDGNQTWDRASEAVYTPPQINQTVLRNLYIFNNQNLGLHTLNVMVNYSYISPVITKNATFMVTEAGAQPPPPGGGPPGAPPAGGEGGAGGGAPVIRISDYPDELGVEVGIARFVNIKIKNTGDDTARNVTLSISGIDAGWFEIDTPRIDSIKPNETKIVPLKILVPAGIKSGEFRVKITAQAPGTKDERISLLRVFTSKKDLIEFEIARLKAKAEELETKAKQAEKEYDVEEVLKLIGQIRSKISEAEGYLSEQRYDAALGSIYAGWTLYSRAAELLEAASARKPFELIPLWLLILIIILVGVVLFLVIVLRKLSLNLKVLLRGRYTEAKAITGIVKREPELENLRIEKGKIERMLSLLETQYKQGIISKEAYDGLRVSSEQKLQNLSERIRKELKV